MKTSMNQLLKYLLYVFLLVLSIILFILLLNKNEELSQVRNRYQNIVEKYEKRKKEIRTENKKEAIKQNTNIKSPNIIHLYGHDIEDMKRKGLSNPVEDIISDLGKHRELIPYKGTLGGTMDFYGNNIWILTNKWVLAHFDDGHTVGYLLLEYTVTNNGKINWKRISAMKG